MPKTNQLRKALRRPEEFTQGELLWFRHLLGECGGFFTALFHAMSHADGVNLARLQVVFPEEVAAFRAWTQGDLAQRVRAIPEHETKGERLQRRPDLES